MDTTTRPTTGRTTFHRDGTVTLWDCITQTWVRGSDPSAELLATLTEPERSRVLRHTPQGPGRPRLWDAKRRPRSVKANDAEWAEVKRRAAEAGMSAGAYVRSRCAG
jgi:hypothetical protein